MNIKALKKRNTRVISKKHSAPLTGFLAFLFFACVGGYHIVPQLMSEYGLMKNHKETIGEITAVAAENHNRCRYGFFVEGKKYEAIGDGCGHAQTGQKITVYFSPGNPAHSDNEEPHTVFINDLVSFLSVLVLLPLFAAFITYKTTKS